MPLLVLVSGLALVACGNDDSGNAATDSATPQPVSSDVRIPLGGTARVPVPADARMVILVPSAWGEAASALRCTAVDTTTGRQAELHPAPADPGAADWVPLWAISAGPTATLEIGCTDPQSKVPADGVRDIRVEPRGASPSPPEVGTPLTVTGDSDGKEISLAPGRRLEVSLAANPSTGYQWELDPLDPAVLQQTGDPEYRSAPGADTAVGVGGTSIWHFVAIAPGKTELRLANARPWEPGIEPAQRFTLHVTVTN
ncbi:protease inhibitor I42 family protein [Nocardia sp. N2S4-5]|uniref:protease inhibitor I42 family protein n=1 Tax=Nocardia sp. N2S4-5 TaxID=3351565 RepID=UPI0037D3351C